MAVRYACLDDKPGERPRPFMVTRAVRDKGRQLGITVDQIIERARMAAPFTSEVANRRHKDIVLFIEDDVIYGLWPLDGGVTPARRLQMAAPVELKTTAPVRQGVRPVPKDINLFRARWVGSMIEGDCPVCADEGHKGCHECRYTGQVKRTEGEWRELLDEMGFV